MINNSLKSVVKNARQRRYLKRGLALLCALVLVFTMNTLKRDANTLERIPMCGYIAEHVHTLDCYDGDTLVCGLAEHIHTDACYQQQPDTDAGIQLDDVPVAELEIEDVNAALSLSEDDFALVSEDVAPAQLASNADENQQKVFALGEEALVSTIINALALDVRLDQIVEVGMVESEAMQTEAVGIEPVGDDYRVFAISDFDRAQLALVLADNVVVIELVDGTARRVPEEIHVGDPEPVQPVQADIAPAAQADIAPAAQADIAPAAQADTAPAMQEDLPVVAEAPIVQAAEDNIADLPAPVEAEPVEEAKIETETESETEEAAIEPEAGSETEEAIIEPEAEPEAEEAAIETEAEPETEKAAIETEAGSETEEAIIETEAEPEAEEATIETEAEPETEEAAIETEAEPETEETVIEAKVEPEAEEAAIEPVTESEIEGAAIETEAEPETEEAVIEIDEQTDGEEIAADTEADVTEAEEATDETEAESDIEEATDETEAEPEGEEATDETEAEPETEEAAIEIDEQTDGEETAADTESDVTEAEEATDETEAEPETEEAAIGIDEQTDGEETAADTEADVTEAKEATDETEAESEAEEATDETEAEPDAEEAADETEAETEAEEAINETEADPEGEEVVDEADATEGEKAIDETDAEEADADAQTVYTATVDLAGVTDYPLSLNALMAEAAPVANAEGGTEEAAEAAETETGEPADEADAAQEEAPEAAPTWRIEYDRDLLRIEEAEGDYLITPVADFGSTVITVENGSRYALTLVNFALPEAEAAAGPQIEYPAQDFEGHTRYVKVVVSAPEGAFPAGTVMAVADVKDEKTLTDIEDTVSEEFVEVKRVHAVDITFTDAEGNEIEPLLPISVVMTVDEIEQQQEAVVVHVDDAGATEVVDSQSEAPTGETGFKVEMPAAEASGEEAQADEAAVGFEADSFSVYAIVVTETIETKYIDAEGATWNISVGYGPDAGIPAGATLAVEEVEGDYLEQTAELLKGRETITLARFFDITILDAEGNAVQPAQPVEVKATLAEQSDDAVKAVHFAEEGPEIIEVSQEDETVSFDAASFSVYGIVYTVDFHFGVDGETYTFTLPGGGAVGMRELAPALGLVEDTEDAVDLFAESIESVAFSDESLVKAVPVEMNMTVGALKQKYELESEYSAELTEAQIAELNDKVLQAPDWALVSLKPFDTEETLTVALATGETFTVTVTDAQLSQTVITASGEAYEITVTYGEDAAIPEGAALKVREILPEDEEYASYLEEARRAASGEAYAEANGEGEYARFFDIEIWANDQKVEPAAPVTVDIVLADAPQTGEALKVVHFDEADGPVVMPTEAGEEGEDETVTEAAKVRFETDGFSVYGVVTVPTASTGVNDLDGRAFTISRNNHYMTSEVIATTGSEPAYKNVQRMKKSDKAKDAAQWHFEAVNASNGEYTIWTLVDNQKKYLHIGRITTTAWEGNADVVLSDSPQTFKVETNGGYYNISAFAQGNNKKYYLNEHYGDQGGDAFAAYENGDGGSLLTLEFNPVTKDVDQYMLVTRYGDDYYVVLNDRRLEKAESVQTDESGNIIAGSFTTPMTWTWDGHHLFHNSVAVGYTSDQRASDYYRRYIDPQSDNGLAQEHGQYRDDNTNVDTEEDLAKDPSRHVFVIVDGSHGKYTVKTVYDRTGAMNDAAFEVSGGSMFKIHDSDKYLGVTRNADGALMLTGNKAQADSGDFWLVDLTKVSGASYVILEKVKNPKQREQYYVIIKEKNSDTYHIVYPDRSLSAGQVGKWADTMSFEAPDKMYLWTYDYEQIYTNDGSEPWAHMDPAVAEGIRKINTATKVTVESDGSIHGVDGKYFTIVNGVLGGNVNQDEEREVYFAKLVSAGDMQYLDGGVLAEMNHMVNHIDIGIIGKARLTLPLAYGTYKYTNPITGEWETYTVSSDEDIELIEDVDITKEDIKRGTIQAYVKDPATNQTTYRDDLFTITGYSANQETPISHDQVRIEGNFKVADLDPVSKDDRDTAETRAARIANKVYYTVSTTKSVEFHFIHKDFGQLYDMEGNLLSVTVDVNMSASFNYWDWKGPEGTQGNNECPPLQPSWPGGTFNKWQGGDGKGQGGIPADGNSGMDFRLGGDAGDDNSNVVALNITKIVEDTQGHRIALDSPMTNTFNVYYGKGVDENTVNNVNRNACNDVNPGVYAGYGENPLHSKSITVGRDGIAIIYDYDVSEGMVYITEDKDTVPDTVTDENGEIYTYHHTVIKTEYVWRTGEDDKSTRHVSKDFTKTDAEFKAIPEKVGYYHLPNGATVDSNGKQLRNGFLDFYVYNVYEPQKINLEVQKKWKQDGEYVDAPVNVNISAVVGRYKLQQDTTYDPSGKLTIEDSFTGIEASQYDVTYTVTGPNGYTASFNRDAFSIAGETLTKSLTGLWGGSYRVTKTVNPISGYTHSPARYSTSVPVPMAGENTVVLKKTSFQQDTAQKVRVSVAIAYALNQDLAHPEDYPPGISMDVNANSTIKFSYDVFHSDGWNRDVDANWYVYEWKTGDSGSEATTYRWRQVGEVHALHAQNADIQVGTNPICLRIDYPNPSEAYKMHIVINDTTITSGSTVSGGDASGDPEEDIPDDDSAQPDSLIEGMVYLPEDGWTRSVTLDNNSWDSAINSWKEQVEESAGSYDFDRYDENGHEYIYYIVDMIETDLDIPEGTRCLPYEYSTRVDPVTGKNTFICIATNDMPSSTEITIKKVNGQNTSELLTAGFELQKYTGSSFSTQDPDWTPKQITVAGTVKVENLGVGYYKLVETSWPAGFVQVSADPRFQVYIDSNSREVKVNFLDGNDGTVNFEPSTNTFTVKNTPKGALKITKVVTVNDQNIVSGLTDGIYTFSIVGSEAATSGENHIVRISFNNGKANGYAIDGDTIGATGTDNQYSVIVSGLTPGKYTITETGSDNRLMRFKSVTGGNGNADGSSITVTVVAGDNTASNASAQVEYTNNREVVDIDATKTWTNNGADVTAQLKNTSVTFTLQSRSQTGENTWTEWQNAAVTAAANGKDAVVELKTEGTASSDQSAWKVSWTNLPKYDEQNCLIQYQVVESKPKVGEDDIDLPAQASAIADHYGAVAGHANPTAQVSLTNPLPTTRISVTKLWKDGTANHADRVFTETKTINFQLYQKLGDKSGQAYVRTVGGVIVGEVSYEPASGGQPASWSTWNSGELPRFVYDETTETWSKASYYVVETGVVNVAITYRKGEGEASSKPSDAAVMDSDTDGDRKITITNTDEPVNVKIKKVDSTNPSKTLAGAEFDLFGPYTGTREQDTQDGANGRKATKKGQVVVGNDGIGDLGKLTSGYYYLYETKAPAGFNMLAEPVLIVVDTGKRTDDGKGAVSYNQSDSTTSKNDTGVDYDTQTRTYSLTITNNPGVSLPATGGTGTTPYHIFGALLALAAAVLLVVKRRMRA